MGASERRERQRAELRSKILDAAREQFAAHGYEAVTLRKVAQAIEYSTTAIYVHFKDKQALIQELVTEDFRKHAVHFQKAASIQDPVERIRENGRLYLEFALKFPNHYRLLFMTSGPQLTRDCADTTPENDSYEFLLSNVRACVDAGRVRAELDNVELIAQLLWTQVHGIASLYITKGRSAGIAWMSAEDTLELQFDIMSRGLFLPAPD